MDQLYPLGPDTDVEQYSAPSANYKRRAWIASLSLLLFIALYLTLTGWFGWLAYKFFSDAIAVGGGGGVLKGLALGAVAGFLTIFLVKALFFVRHGGEINDIEVTAENQPDLFKFLFQLADDAGAPRPHRVFLSPRVNAAVFYDLTLLNLIFPSKKNLEIGLGLVNALTLSELKAVLAHEFGHFRQGSMAVGRWVYIAQQIATHIIQERDILDRFLLGLSRFDLRIAWVGWILRLIVWSLRALLDTAFSLVVLAQRSLSREMEFHADLVSVSLTGSDALIHALHRLHAADDSWSRALGIAGEELGEGRAITDIFAIQKLITQRMKDILADENYDTPPVLPETDRATHRVFETDEVQPPQMWSTHPPNHAREENAKREYLHVAEDDRPGWALFKDAPQLREQMTAHILGGNMENAEIKKAALTETVSTVDKQYGKAIYERRYRGAYLGRSVVREYASAEEMVDDQQIDGDPAQRYTALYPESLTDEIEHWQKLEQERVTLRSLYDGNLTTIDGVNRHRGEILKRRQIPKIIETLGAECDESRRLLANRDRDIRSVNRAAARSLGSDWESYHKGLTELLHYAGHSEANVIDVRGRLANLWSVVMADGKVSAREVKQLLVVAEDIHGVLSALERQKEDVDLGPRVAEELGVDNWRGVLSETYAISAPDKNNIGDWLGVIDGWLNYFQQSYTRLHQETLEVLLAHESGLESAIRDGKTPASAPAAPKVPAEYATLLPNNERKRQTRLGLWDRFQTASGFLPGLARLAVAGTVVGGLSGLGMYAGSADVTIYNGLATTVDVQLGGKRVSVDPLGTASVSPGSMSKLSVETKTETGQIIEAFSADVSNSLTDYVYNVAGAAPMVEWTASYGDVAEVPPRFLGATRWLSTNASYIFKEPPNQIDTSGDGGKRTVLDGFGGVSPQETPEYLPDGASLEDLSLIHARWDDADAPNTLAWIGALESEDKTATIARARLERDPNEVLALRLEQDTANGADVCQRHREQAQAVPENSDWQYLSMRCIEDADARNKAVLSAYGNDQSNPWIAASAGYALAGAGQWAQAEDALGSAFQKLPPMRIGYADELARIRRMQHGTKDASLDDLVNSSRYLQFLAFLQSDEEATNDSVRAYQLFVHGELEAATSQATDLAERPDDLLRLIGASDDASAAMIATARSLAPDTGINSATIWTALGFAKRHGIAVEPFLQQLDDVLKDNADIARATFGLLNSGTIDVASFEHELRLARPATRGYAYVMGVVALGERSPAKWRENAKRLLFSYERPKLD